MESTERRRSPRRAGLLGAPLRAAAVALALLSAVPAPADEAYLYVMHCRGCHGPEGQGAAGGAPDLRDTIGRFLLVPGGREYLIRVPGTSQSELDDAQTAALLNWMVRRFGPRAAATALTPFTAAEVAAHRRPALLDVRATRAALLAAMPATP
ncbi:cytochrome c [bacterium]|nr:cytochrome c [bacterium]